MEILTPTFTNSFKCIADKCTYSCCKNWSIAFSKEQRQNFIDYGITDIDEHSEIRNSDSYVMKLSSNGNCPYLDESGLCKMILKCGNDKVLCNICQTFPRIINNRSGMAELTLSNACPAVLQILEATPCPIVFEIINNNYSLSVSENSNPELIESRNTMIDLMQIADLPIWTRLYIIFSFAKKIKEQKKIKLLIEQYNSVEYLLEIYKQLLDISINMPIKLQILEDFLGSIHNKKSTDLYEKHFSELFDLSLKISIDKLTNLWTEFDSIFIKQDSFMENIAVNDIFRNIRCNNSENFYYSTIMLILMMSLIKFTTFLEWINNEKSNININKFNIISYFARKFEHIDFESLKKGIIEFENNGLLDVGCIFTLLK